MKYIFPELMIELNRYFDMDLSQNSLCKQDTFNRYKDNEELYSPHSLFGLLYNKEFSGDDFAVNFSDITGVDIPSSLDRRIHVTPNVKIYKSYIQESAVLMEDNIFGLSESEYDLLVDLFNLKTQDDYILEKEFYYGLYPNLDSETPLYKSVLKILNFLDMEKHIEDYNTLENIEVDYNSETTELRKILTLINENYYQYLMITSKMSKDVILDYSLSLTE